MIDISANFFILNGIVVVLLVIYMIWRRPSSRTRRRISDPPSSATPRGLKALAKELENMSGEPPAEQNSDEPDPVIFNWNGHSWDAYEVLGIPAGSTRIEVNKAFQEEIQKITLSWWGYRGGLDLGLVHPCHTLLFYSFLRKWNKQGTIKNGKKETSTTSLDISGNNSNYRGDPFSCPVYR